MQGASHGQTEWLTADNDSLDSANNGYFQQRNGSRDAETLVTVQSFTAQSSLDGSFPIHQPQQMSVIQSQDQDNSIVIESQVSDLRTRLINMTFQASEACGIQIRTLMSLLCIDALEQRLSDESDNLSRIRTMEGIYETLQNLKKGADEQNLLDNNLQAQRSEVSFRLQTMQLRMMRMVLQTSSISGIRLKALVTMVGIDNLPRPGWTSVLEYKHFNRQNLEYKGFER
jgi:hypothetical protein